VATVTIADALHYGQAVVTNSESPKVDAQVLLCHVLDCQTTYLHTWADRELTPQQRTQFIDLIAERQQGRPVAYLIGQRGFWSLDLKVTTDTLIPRPDTELLVSLALSKLKPNMNIVDLGTGTGAIALSLAIENRNTIIIAMDYSKPALDVAKQNAQSNNINNISFWQGSWLSAIANNSLDMIVSNPPYIEQDDPHLSQGDVRFEPITALASGVDGLDDIRQIIQQAQQCLKSSGWLLIEHGYHQADQVRLLFSEAEFTQIASHKDFGGNDRVTMGRLAV